MKHARITLASPDLVRPVPAWARVKTLPSNHAEAAFGAGVSLSALDNLVRQEPAYVGVWRQRLAQRLLEDHANARALARGLAQIAGIEVQHPETNLVFFKPDGTGVSGGKMVSALHKRGVLLAMMDGRIRACTHLDVTPGMIEETVGLVREIVRGV